MGYTLRRPPGTDAWHCYFIDREGKRFRRSTRQADKRRADHVAADWFRRFADPTYQAAHETTLEDAGRRMKEALAQAGRSAETVKFYGVKLSHVGRVLGADTALVRITAARVDEYIAARKAEGAKPYTISKELTALRMLLKHARRRGEFDRELSQVMPIGFATGYRPRERRLTVAQAWALIHELPDGAARYAALVCATTARDSAAKRSRGKHLTTAGIEVFDKKTKRSTRTVPLNRVTEDFAFYAFRGVAADALVCPGVASVRHAFDRACKRLGLPHVSPNDLRRSVAHWLLERGVPRDVAASFMGHANTKMLDAVYGKLDAGELAEALRRSLGSSLDGSWKNAPNPVDGVDSVDGKKAEKSCAGTESNRRHGDFQSPQGSRPAAGNAADLPVALDDSWIRRAVVRLRAEAATDEEIARRFARGVALAKAGRQRESDANLRTIRDLLEARALAGKAAAS